MSETVEVANFRTRVEAEIAGALLDNADIAYVIQSQEGMLHGPMSTGATLLVSKGNLERAAVILADVGDVGDESEGGGR